MATVHQVADYIVAKLEAGRSSVSTLKLQKLLYYVQAWSLATKGERAFPGEFQAWVHGPVCRDVFDRFKDKYSLYDVVRSDESMRESASRLDGEAQIHVDEILEAYSPFSGTQLEIMTHREDPWIIARGDCKPLERCETVIKDEHMKTYYARMLKDIEAEEAKV